MHGDIPMEHLRGITTDAARPVNSFRHYVRPIGEGFG
jgi:hypothetical protein